MYFRSLTSPFNGTTETFIRSVGGVIQVYTSFHFRVKNKSPTNELFGEKPLYEIAQTRVPKSNVAVSNGE